MIAEFHPVVMQFLEWRRIHSFPAYSVSNTGLVRNEETGRQMTRLVNQSGVVNVGLTKNRVQYKRAVALLVVKAFFTVMIQEPFDTPINLNGDRFDNRVDNLAIRPRWYATKYFHQFEEGPYDAYAVEDVGNGERFDSIWDAAVQLGLLQSDIAVSVHSGRPVWPTNQVFRAVD
jgi:hypothetical protein